MPYLTDDLVRSLPPPARGSRIVFDSNPEGVTDAAVVGLGIRVTAGAFKAFTLSYRNAAGDQRRYTIGPFPRWRTERARREARRLREDVIDRNKDPQAAKVARRNAPTVNVLLDKFLSEHVEKECRPGTAKGYRSIIRLYVRPALGKKQVAAVTTANVRTMFREIGDAGHRHRANSALAVVSKAFSLAIGEWDLCPSGVNPCRGIKRYREEHRHRPGQIGAHLTPDELMALGTAMAGHPDTASVRAIRVMLLTGCRKSEALGMKWADIDMAESTWSRQAVDLKGKRAHKLPLSPAALEMLSQIRAEQTAGGQLSEHVFPGAGSSGHLVDVKRTWLSLCRAAGIVDARLHDLRHTHAALLASGGASLPLIGSLLGHASAASTQRYSSLFLDPQRRAVAMVAAALDHKPADVVPLKKRGR